MELQTFTLLTIVVTLACHNEPVTPGSATGLTVTVPHAPSYSRGSPTRCMQSFRPKAYALRPDLCRCGSTKWTQTSPRCLISTFAVQH